MFILSARRCYYKNNISLSSKCILFVISIRAQCDFIIITINSNRYNNKNIMFIGKGGKGERGVWIL